MALSKYMPVTSIGINNSHYSTCHCDCNDHNDHGCLAHHSCVAHNIYRYLMFFNLFSSLGNFASNEGQVYCKPHFMELFKSKGKCCCLQCIAHPPCMSKGVSLGVSVWGLSLDCSVWGPSLGAQSVLLSLDCSVWGSQSGGLSLGGSVWGLSLGA